MPVRYASVDTATQRPTALQGDTRWDREETARQRENLQLAGRLRRQWHLLGSNQRRLSRRFYGPSLLPGSHAADQRIRASRRDSGPPPSAIRPCAPGVGHGRGRRRPPPAASSSRLGGRTSSRASVGPQACDAASRTTNTAEESASQPLTCRSGTPTGSSLLSRITHGLDHSGGCSV
jgi:hypothetical protein